ncbi:Ankyrin repeat and SAM domain-containing protein 6 [Amphibalanus amphitrite]|uniref:Ankyrin repeat and SAM domain-containing protein 6 n=1 Tax=Amphibalanus amphitrite TaxID=1232801 RepID=A0A6A4UYJ7_AMPAM|nr:Ankyrin repeat and SAM domain-containing protein 6 [Amphibalanus amphitrite]
MMEENDGSSPDGAIGAFLDSCYKGDQAAIASLLEKGVDVNGSDAVYTTPLQVAAASGHETLVQLLMARGAQLEAANLYGWTPLMHAARHGHAGVVRLLLQRGADGRRCNRLGTCCVGVRGKGVDRGKAEYSQRSLNALMLAAVGGHRSTCRILLEAGADPNAHNTLGMTALDMARVAGHRQVVRVLEDSTEEAEDTGGECGRGEEGDSTDLHEAVRRRDLTLATQLLSADPGAANRVRSESGAPLTLAALAGDTPMAALLLRHGAVVDQPEPTTGWTPLMHAVFHNHPEMVKLLLSSGADANVRDHKGCTAFDLASLVDSSPDMIRLLAACTYKFTPPVPPAGLAGGPAPLAWQSRAVSAPSLQDRGLKAWWSRFSSRFQNVRARVEPVVMTGARPLPEETGVPQDADRSRPRLTLDGVLPAAKRLKARTPQGFPARSLPSDTLRPVLPPFCADRSALDRCRLPPALCEGPADCDNGPDSAAVPAASAGSGPAPGGGHLNTYRLLSYLRSPNSSPSNSLGQRRLLSPGPHSSGDSGFETSGKSSIDHPSYLRKAAKGSPAKRGSLKQKPSLRKKPTTTAADPPSAAEPATSDGQAVGKLTYLLRSLGLARYGSAFAAEEIDFEAFLDLTDDDLVELNVSRRDRQKLAVVIQELRQKLRV